MENNHHLRQLSISSMNELSQDINRDSKDLRQINSYMSEGDRSLSNKSNFIPRPIKIEHEPSDEMENRNGFIDDEDQSIPDMPNFEQESVKVKQKKNKKQKSKPKGSQNEKDHSPFNMNDFEPEPIKIEQAPYEETENLFIDDDNQSLSDMPNFEPEPEPVKLKEKPIKKKKKQKQIGSGINQPT